MKFDYFKKYRGDNDLFAIKEGSVGKLDNFSYRLEWTEDSFVSGNKEREVIGRNFNFSKVRLVAGAFFIFLFFIIFRIAQLQIFKGDYYYAMAEGNRIRSQRIEAKRGIIYDRNRIVLSRNTPNFLLYFIPFDLPEDNQERQKIILEVSGILGDKTPEEINNAVNEIKPRSLESYQPLFIADNIDYEKAMALYLKSSNDWPGVVLANKSRREYNIASSSLSHVIGYTGKINSEELKKSGSEYLPIDYIGKMGIEYFWEPNLKGVSGKKQIEVDALGKEKKVINEVLPRDGNNLVLSIDTNLQKKTEDALKNALEKIKLKKGVAIVMDPNNGEILSLVSLPAYDSNDFAKGISTKQYSELINSPDRPLFNRAVSGEYPSGSTIKPVMSAAALQEGVITENTSVLSVGGINVGQWFFPDWKAGGHGQTSVRKAIAESVNTFYYYIGGGYQDFRGLGIDRIIKYEKLFGLGEQTGIDLPGEASGFLPTKEWKEKTKGEKWYIGDTYHVSIGQGDILTTPLQVALYTSFFANGGKVYRPHIVKEILSGKDELVSKIEEPPVRSDFISPYNIKVVREGMRQTVTAGSARSLSVMPVEVAGKTGTAQWSSKEDTHAWFTCFAPYERAEIAITILIEAGGEGSTVSVPVAKEILEWYFNEYKKR